MTSARTRSEGTGPGRTDVLPLRSLALVWVFLSALGLLVLTFATRGIWSGEGNRAKGPAAPASKGPTKKQVRERQEHIALTERALELARKERKAAEAPVSAPVSGTTGAAASPAVAPESSAAPAPRPAPRATSGATASGEPAAAAASAPAEKAAAKPAAGGLDAMRADIAAALE